MWLAKICGWDLIQQAIKALTTMWIPFLEFWFWVGRGWGVYAKQVERSSCLTHHGSGQLGSREKNLNSFVQLCFNTIQDG